MTPYCYQRESGTFWVSLVFCLLFSSSAIATEMVGAMSSGMGGTGRAGVEAQESLFLNPAGLALVEQFYTGFSYQSGFLQKDASRNTYGVVLTDAGPKTPIPGAFAYRRHSINSQGSRLIENEFRLGFAYRITPRVSLGMGGVHLIARDEGGSEFIQNNLDFGTLIGLMPEWGLSFSGENLVRPSGQRPQALQRPSRVALGTQYIFDRRITLRYEALMPLYVPGRQLLGHRVGLGLVARGRFYLNSGYSVDDSRGQNWASVGLAWKGPRLKLAYSYQEEQRQGLGIRHLVDTWFDF